MNRLVGFLIVVTWGVALSALLMRDVVPFWRAQEPPPGVMPPGDFQTGIYAARKRVGTCWASLQRQQDIITLQSQTELENIPLVGALGRFLIETDFHIAASGRELIGFEIGLYSNGAALAEFDGHRVGEDYSCSVHAGEFQQSFSLDARATGLLGDATRPFHHLSHLRVGQTWQIRMLDVTSLLRDQRAEIRPQIVRVTARETIDHGGLAVSCFRIETDGATAWAADDGRVIRQRVSLPLLGELELRDEPYDAKARAQARRAVPATVRNKTIAPRARGR